MKTTHGAGLAGLAMLALAPAAQAITLTQGDSALDISGIVNGYYVYRTEKTPGAPTVSSSGISSGLLPGWINFVFTTKAGGWDVKAHVGLAPGINDNSSIIGLPDLNLSSPTVISASPYSQIDTRANYLSFGKADVGTFKFGRDIGIFGTQVILSDMTLLGVGGTSNASQPFNTTFGMIGHGYMYTGFQAQISYTSPKLGAAQFQAGIFQPKNFAGDQSKTPGLQVGATFDVAPAKLWAGAVTQKTDCQSGGCSITPFTAGGFELGGKVAFGPAEFVAYTFKGDGLGISTVGAQFLGGSDGAGNKTKSDGYFLQATYKMGDTKLGVNYGSNKDKGGVFGAGNTIKRDAFTFGVYQTLNKFVTLVGEVNHENNKSNGANTGKVDTLTMGAIMFF